MSSSSSMAAESVERAGAVDADYQAVYIGDIMINAELVRLGYAVSYTYPPDVKYQDLILQLEKEARENNCGLWAKKTSD